MEKLTHIVLDDFMPPSLQDHIETVTMYNDNLEWGFRDRITPKKGRAVLFHSNRFHASSNPVVAQRRVIINHVFTTDDNFLTKID